MIKMWCYDRQHDQAEARWRFQSRRLRKVSAFEVLGWPKIQNYDVIPLISTKVEDDAQSQ